jgi:predicted Fe-Mo cluster-binding NifX family protein
VSADGTNLDAPIDRRFVQCRFFEIMDTHDKRVQTLDNERIALSGGAGGQAAQFLASKGVDVVITGNIGPNAVTAISAAGVEVVSGRTGPVRKAIDDYRKMA